MKFAFEVMSLIGFHIFCYFTVDVFTFCEAAVLLNLISVGKGCKVSLH